MYKTCNVFVFLPAFTIFGSLLQIQIPHNRWLASFGQSYK